MEFLSNMWIAFTTPNENIIDVITFIGNFIESFFTLLLFSSILKIKFTKTESIKYILIISILGYLSKIFIPAPFCIIITLLIVFLCIKFIFKLNILKSIIAEFVPYIIIVLLELIIINFYATIFKIDIQNFMIIPIYKILGMTTIYTLLYIISILLKKLPLSFNLLDNIDRRNKFILILNFILGIISIATQSYLTSFYGDNFPFYVIIINFVSLLTYFIISIYSLYKANKLEKTSQELESAESYNKTLSVLYDSVKCFKHDFDNIVTTIGGFITTDDMEGLKQYYSELEKECQYLNNISALNPNIINNNGVYNLLASKYAKASDLNIELHIEFLLDLNTLNMKIYEFTRILGILIDNAIEAAEECNDKKVNLKFRNEEKRNRQLVIIENTYNDKNINTEEIFNKGISGKEDHTGLGLWEVRKILKKNNNLNLYTTKDEKLFKQQLEIYYK